MKKKLCVFAWTVTAFVSHSQDVFTALFGQKQDIRVPNGLKFEPISYFTFNL